MVVQRIRRTQTSEYWLESFAVGKDDVDQLYEWMLEESTPQTIDELGLRLVANRCSSEEETLLKQTDEGAIYQPQERFDVGQAIVFPALDYAAAQVVAVREGNNPRYSPFSVMQVRMEADESLREFATEFELDHPLNRSAILLDDSDDIMSPAQLYELYGREIRNRLRDALVQTGDFVHFGEQWLLRGLMPEVSPFHLNIAEAMIDEHGRPMSVSELLGEVQLSTAKVELQRYALGFALGQDPRFATTSLEGESTWYLSALIPAAVSEKPAHLVPRHRAVGGEWLNRELRDFVEELQDDADELEGQPAPEPATSAPFHLIYPHLREGTLPLTRHALSLLQERPSERFLVTFVDPRNNEEMPGWMMPGERYGWGLGEWYGRHAIPIGAQVTIRPGDAPFQFLVAFEKGKRRSEWLREAKVLGGKLTFGMQRKAFPCQYDKHLVVDVGSAEDLDPVWVNSSEEAQSLFDLLTEVFLELAKLSSQGAVHAKALYSAVNLTRRCGAVPVFAHLTKHACFDPVGDGNWVYDESLRGVTYEALEDMRRRPKSRRQDLIVDTVYQYGVKSEVQGP